MHLAALQTGAEIAHCAKRKFIIDHYIEAGGPGLANIDALVRCRYQRTIRRAYDGEGAKIDALQAAHVVAQFTVEHKLRANALGRIFKLYLIIIDTHRETVARAPDDAGIQVLGQLRLQFLVTPGYAGNEREAARVARRPFAYVFIDIRNPVGVSVAGVKAQCRILRRINSGNLRIIKLAKCRRAEALSPAASDQQAIGRPPANGYLGVDGRAKVIVAVITNGQVDRQFLQDRDLRFEEQRLDHACRGKSLDLTHASKNAACFGLRVKVLEKFRILVLAADHDRHGAVPGLKQIPA